jgi:hypothetical protein
MTSADFHRDIYPPRDFNSPSGITMDLPRYDAHLSRVSVGYTYQLSE